MSQYDPKLVRVYIDIYVSFGGHNLGTFLSSRKHTYIILTPLNPTFI